MKEFRHSLTLTICNGILFEMSGARVTSLRVTNTHNLRFHSAHILEGVGDCPHIGETFSDLCVNDVLIPQLGIC